MTARPVVLAAAALTLGGCDRLPQGSLASAVTVKLPAPRTPTPGFAFAEQQKPAPQPHAPATLREGRPKEYNAVARGRFG